MKKYQYVKNKNLWFKKEKSLALKVGDKIFFNKAKKQESDLLEGLQGDFDDTVKCGTDGRLYVSCSEGDIYLSDFISEDVTEKYAAIKNEIKNYVHQKENSRMLLVTSFDKYFNYKIPIDIADIFNTIGKITKNETCRCLFTYETWLQFGCPIFSDNLIVTNNSTDYNTVYKFLTPTQKTRCIVLRSDIYTMTDGRCNLDIVIDLVKLECKNNNKKLLLFLQPHDINNIFFLCDTVLVFRYKKEYRFEVGDSTEVSYIENKKQILKVHTIKEVQEKGYVLDDGSFVLEILTTKLKFPTDKFVAFFQNKKEYPSSFENYLIQEFTKTYL